MINLPDVLTQVLAAIGPETETRMGELIHEFGSIPLSEEDRLSALAGTIATIAVTRYCKHRTTFIAALCGWSLELSNALMPPPLPVGRFRPAGPVNEAQDALLSGIDAILHLMTDAGTDPHHCLVAELAVIARLLGRYDASSIHLVLTAVTHAIEDEAWLPGCVVPVCLLDATTPLSRDINIAMVAPRGTA
jgi:hypothetical protein